METGNLFESQNVNPLAGCLPSLAQIPVFLGVYYSVTAIAKAKIFTEGPSAGTLCGSAKLVYYRLRIP
jgi:YidC/Oxa1 family membrane protein insertase